MAPGKPNRALLIGVSAVTSCTFFVLSLVGLHWFLTSKMQTTGPPSFGDYECNRPWTNQELFGLLMFFFLFPPAIIFLLFSSYSLYKYRSVSTGLRAIIFTMLAAFCIYGMVVGSMWGQPLLRCGYVNCMNSNKDQTLINGLKETIGTIFLILSAIGFFYYAYLVLNLLLWSQSGRPEKVDEEKNMFRTRLYDPNSRRRSLLLSSSFLLILFFPLLLFICGILPNTFNEMTPAIIKYYAGLNVANDAATCSSDPTVMCPEYPGVALQTLAWKVNDNVYVKFFPDVVIYYVFLWFIVLVATAAQLIPGLNKLLHHNFVIRRNLPDAEVHSSNMKKKKTFFSFTLGQALLFSAFVVMASLWLKYWYGDHNWVGGPERTKTERWARTFGEFASMFMGFLVFPISRNSLFTHVFGISWEAMAAIHRVFGYAALVCVACHMFCWWGALNEQGFFPHDVLSFQLYYPSNGHLGPPCADNFTIFIATITTFVMFITMGVFTFYTIRRLRFELFYFAHHFFLTILAVAVLHGASAWYWMVGGLALWLGDRTIRLFNGIHNVTVADICAIKPEVTQITFQVLPGFSLSNLFWGRPAKVGPLNHELGQYLFLNVPDISLSEWHPFTISSSAYDASNTLHIKNMGEGTFTGQLFQLAASTSPSAAEHLTVNIDGPYGLPFNFQNYDAVILIAGGIGITPCHSIFRGLYQLAMKGMIRARIHLLWVARESALFTIDSFVNTFTLVNDNSLQGAFSYSLYCTRKDAPTAIAHKTGRPDLRTEISLIRSAARPVISSSTAGEELPQDSIYGETAEEDIRGSSLTGDHTAPLLERPSGPRGGKAKKRALVFACGPTRLIEDCEAVADEIGLEFHSETFVL